jgi:UDP-N-acetylglucosamine 4-epimerase
MIRNTVAENFPEAAGIGPLHQDFRAGDIRHSLANIGKAHMLLGYEPEFHVKEGLDFSGGCYLG